MNRPWLAPLAVSSRRALRTLAAPDCSRTPGDDGHALLSCDGPARCSLSFTVPSDVAARGRLPEWPKGAVCKTVGSAYDGSNPSPATTWKVQLRDAPASLTHVQPRQPDATRSRRMPPPAMAAGQRPERHSTTSAVTGRRRVQAPDTERVFALWGLQ